MVKTYITLSLQVVLVRRELKVMSSKYLYTLFECFESPNRAPSLVSSENFTKPVEEHTSLPVLRPVLEDREKTFDSSVSVEFKVEGIC